jgi:lysine 2,3-aminomutase
VHQVEEYDHERGISYWTKNYRNGIELADPDALTRRYEYYDPIHVLPGCRQAWWRSHGTRTSAAAAQQAAESRAAAAAQHERSATS